jgi:hypothetical protein
MRIALLAFVLALAPASVRAATAYEALRILGKQRGEAVLDNVTELRGTKGAPQPREWKIIVAGSASRGGTKEFTVEGTRLVGEKAALFKTGGAPMNMSQLNLDSDGAHQLAEREAKNVGFAYDHADYTLRAGAKGGSPVWEIRLVDLQSGEVATLNIAATDGAILKKEGLVPRRGATASAPPPRDPRAYPQPDNRQPPPVLESPSPGLQRAGDGLNSFVVRVGRHMGRRGRQIGDTFHNLFSKDKRHTAGPHGSAPDNDLPPPSRATNETDYAPPSRVRD